MSESPEQPRDFLDLDGALLDKQSADLWDEIVLEDAELTSQKEAVAKAKAGLMANIIAANDRAVAIESEIDHMISRMQAMRDELSQVNSAVNSSCKLLARVIDWQASGMSYLLDGLSDSGESGQGRDPEQ